MFSIYTALFTKYIHIWYIQKYSEQSKRLQKLGKKKKKKSSTSAGEAFTASIARREKKKRKLRSWRKLKPYADTNKFAHRKTIHVHVYTYTHTHLERDATHIACECPLAVTPFCAIPKMEIQTTHISS